MGARIRAHDWDATPLGPLHGWPQSLRSALSICLHSSFPTAIYWGPELRLIYNDAWAPVAGERHPWALGRPAAEVWSDIWEVVGPQFHGVLTTGSGFSAYDQMLPMVRGGLRCETYWNYSFTPIRGENGQVVGVFNQGHETTEKVFAARRAALLLELSDRIRALAEPAAIIDAAQEALGRLLDADRVGYGEVDAGERHFTAARNWVSGRAPSRGGSHDLAAFGPEALASLRAGVPLLIPDVALDRRTRAPEALATFDAIGARAVITASLVKDGVLRAVVYVHACEPRPWGEADARLVVEVAERTWAAVERALAEQRQREDEARLAAIVESAPIGIGVVDPDGEISLSNPELRRFLRENVIPSRAQTPEGRWRAWTPDGAPVAAGDFPVARALRGEQVVPGQEMLFTDDDGREIWTSVATVPIRDAGGRLIGHVVTISDIDALKRNAEALRRSEARLRQLNETLEQRVAEALAERKLFADIVEGTDAFVQVLDLDFRFLAINEASGREYERQYGFRPKEGDSLLELAADRPGERMPAFWARALAGEEFIETVEVTTLGRRQFYQLKFNTLRDGAGDRIGAYLFAYDVTDRVLDQERLAEAQDALRQSQKMEAIGQLTGGVAHDFNNLLTPIIGSLDILQRRGLGGEREQRLIGGALQSAERARTLVQRLLAFARRQPLQAVAVDVAKLVTSMGELVASTTGPQVKVVVNAAADLPPAKADANQLEMALLNLSVNARDAMPEGGVLRITAAAETLGRGHRSGARPGRYVRLSVADTGVGMDPLTLSRAVEPFFSTKGVGKGTGLGLSMVHGLASQLGGGLAIRSRPGLGTNVELWLPQSAEAPEQAPPPAGTARPDGASGTALLVDDEDVVRASTADMLEDLGYRVVEATSAEEALRALDEGLEFDLLVTDHLMPGMNGADLAREVQTRRPGAAVLVVSGYAENDGVAPDLTRLTKPFRQDELQASLAAASRS
jgi:PAS domain S-box-containing protein